MELANIEKLLKKYLDAETSITEENELKTYFLSDNVAPHLLEYQSLFTYFAISKKEEYTKPIQLKTEKRSWKWLSVAASVVLLVSLYAGYENHQQQKEAEKIFNDTQMAFSMLSANLNKGNEAILQLQHFENATKKVFKQPKK